MDVRRARSKTGLSEAAYVRKLNPFMLKRKSSITKTILGKIEAGDHISDHRMDALIASIQEAFPEFSDTDITPTAKIPFTEKHRHHLIFLVFLLISLLVLGLYYYFGLKDVVSDTLTIMASVAGVLAFIFAIYKVTS